MSFNPDGKKVAVAMSGGVDSSTAALLLKEKGFEVVGVTGFMFESPSAEEAVNKARNVCESIGIEHHTVNLVEPFKKCVISYFEDNYISGLTPNPCACCNRTIKWGILKDYAINVIGADYYATGHYARIMKDANCYKLCKAKDSKKDQIYVLFSLTQEDLSRTLFPLGEYTKPEIRELAGKFDVPTAKSKESQDICFIQLPDTTKKYLIRKFGENTGNIVDIRTNKILGKHNGAFHYTIGQRKGIGIAAAEPLYVVKTDLINNTVYVGFKSDVFKSELTAKNVNWQQEEFKNGEFKALVKIRYNTPPEEALVIPQSDNNSVTIRFIKPVSAITPGQVAVFYDLNNEYIIGGGWIN